MAITPARPEEYADAQQFLRSEIRVPRAEARNVATAAETDADSYIRFRGTLYKAPPLSYKIGIQLQEIHLQIQSLSKMEKGQDLDSWEKERKVQHLELLLACYERAIAFFPLACYPVAFWKRWGFHKNNPFADCSSHEIGELLGFFFMCRMKSRVNILGSLANRPSLSTMSTQQTI